MLVALHDLLGVDDRQRKHGGISNDSAFFDNCHCAHEDLVAPLNEIFVGGVHDVAFQMNFVDVIQKVCPSQMAVVLLSRGFGLSDDRPQRRSDGVILRPGAFFEIHHLSMKRNDAGFLHLNAIFANHERRPLGVCDELFLLKGSGVETTF